MARMDWIRNIVEWPIRGRQQALMRARQSYSKEEFIGFFAGRGIASEIADEVWKILTENAAIGGFKPHPEDDLLKVYGLAEEDLDEDVVLELLQRCGCRIPPPAEIDGLKPLTTVADLVDFLSEMKRPAGAK